MRCGRQLENIAFRIHRLVDNAFNLFRRLDQITIGKVRIACRGLDKGMTVQLCAGTEAQLCRRSRSR